MYDCLFPPDRNDCREVSRLVIAVEARGKSKKKRKKALVRRARKALKNFANDDSEKPDRTAILVNGGGNGGP